jgi:hypothetical protein
MFRNSIIECCREHLHEYGLDLSGNPDAVEHNKDLYTRLVENSDFMHSYDEQNVRVIHIKSALLTLHVISDAARTPM